MTCVLHDQSSKRKLPQMFAVLTGNIPILPQKTALLHISKTIFTINYIISKSWCETVPCVPQNYFSQLCISF